MPIDNEKRKRTGLAVLIALSMLTGVLVATNVSGAEFATVGTIAEDNQAYAIPLDGDRVQFSLEAGDGAQTPTAQFAVYDPEDVFFASFELIGDGDDVEILIDQPGHWVIFVTEARNADLTIGIEDHETEDENASTGELIELEVNEVEKTVVEEDGEPLDETFVMRIAHRPAVAFLKVDGEVTDLDATISTEEGVVFQVTDATQNETSDGIATSTGDYVANLDNLVAGIYEVQATAGSLDGELLLAYQTYERGAFERPERPETPEIPEPTPFQGAMVAELEEGQAALVDTQGANELAFQLEEDSHAHVLIFNSTDAVTQVVELSSEHDDHDRHEDPRSEENQTPAPGQPEIVELEAPGQYVVYVSHLDEDDRLTVLLPGAVDAERAELLDIEETEVTLTGENSTQEVELAGGLVAIGAHQQHSMEITWQESLEVTGPEGTVLKYSENLGAFGGGIYSEYQVHPEHFSAGLFHIEADSDGLGLFDSGETTVLLKSFVR